MGKIKICVVEDDAAYVFLLKVVIRSVSENIDVTTFANGKLAADFFTQHAADVAKLPDLIFLDLNMPVMDGWQFLEVFEKLQPLLKKPIPLYILSSSISERDIVRARQNKLVVSFIEKPLEEATLATIISHPEFKTNL